MDFDQFFADVPVLRAILGFVLVFFLPGFAWTLVIFHKINVLERIALSFGLSVALVTLCVIILNLVLDLRINGINALLTIIIITIIPAVIYLVKRLLTRRPDTLDGD